MPTVSGCPKISFKDYEVNDDAGEETPAFNLHGLSLGTVPTIPIETCKLYQNKILVEGDRQYILYPYFVEGKCVAAKARLAAIADEDVWDNKNFKWVGTPSKVQLYGMQTVNMHYRKEVCIVEGESDAQAGHSMYSQIGWVSVPNGASNAADAVKRSLKWLMQFDTIYLSFDQDEAGQTALNAVQKILPVGRVKIVYLPEGYKDARSMLVDQKDKEFRQCILSAQLVQPKGIVDADEAVRRTLEYLRDRERNIGTCTGYAGLDALIGGFKPTEIITVAARTGVGKTTITLNLVYNAAKAGLKVFVMPLEMSFEQVLAIIGEMHLETQLIGNLNFDEEAVVKGLTELTERIMFYDYQNDVVEPTIENITTMMEFVAKAHNVNVILFDHKDATVRPAGKATDWLDSQDVMAQLNKVVIQNRINLWLISQITEHDTKVKPGRINLRDVRGYSAISHFSFCVLGLDRDDGMDNPVLFTLKPHRLIGQHGEVLLQYNRITRRVSEVDINGKQSGKDEKWFREVGGSKQPADAIRAKTVQLHSGILPRLSDVDQERKESVHRVQGSSDPTGQNEVNPSEKREPGNRLENIVSRRKQKALSETEAFYNVRPMGTEVRF